MSFFGRSVSVDVQFLEWAPQFRLLLVFLPVVMLLVSCKQKPQGGLPLAANTDVVGSNLLVERLHVRRTEIAGWAQRCGLSVAKQHCDVGDAALFNGLMCLSGDAPSCEAVRRSQGSDGRMWRSETRVDAESVNSFSRDMALGVFAYLLERRDTVLARSWMDWIEMRGMRMCRVSSDNRCSFTPGFWMLFRDVWSFVGLPTTASMNSAVVDDSVLALLQAQFAPAGFEMHLAGVNALLRKTMGQQSPALNALTSSLHSRQPLNPFFAYLALEDKARVAEKTLAWCPAAKPPQLSQWSFERDQQTEPWKHSMGWECIMLINFLLKDVGDPTAGG